MATVSSSSGSTAAQYGLDQLRLQQTRRNAERAEQTAQSLQADAAEARRAADRANESARSLEIQSSQAQSDAFMARQGIAMIQATAQNAAQLSRVPSNMVVQQQSGQEKTTVAKPVVNTQGQVTGKVVNTTA